VAPSGGSAGFKKGGFKSSFATIKGTAAPTPLVKKKNVLEDDDEDDIPKPREGDTSNVGKPQKSEDDDAESETDEYDQEGYYDPRRPTDCFAGCVAQKVWCRDAGDDLRNEYLMALKGYGLPFVLITEQQWISI
jgi:hypothetical protein